MGAYMTLAGGMVLMPCIYCGVILWYRSSFQKEENKGRVPFRTLPEAAVMILAEAALVRVWWSLGKCTASDMMFRLLAVMLTAMTIFCMTDYWEQVVPNRILLALVLLFVIILGAQHMRDAGAVSGKIPAIVMGLLFTMLSFGLGYLISRRGMGAGDVKLAMVMGLYLTGEYVVGAVFYGCILGAVFSIVQLVRGKLSRKDAIPFVPFLYLGMIIRYLVG